MDIQKYRLLFLLALWVPAVQAQKFELGKVSMKELQEKACPSDSSAAAAVLYSKAKTFFKYDGKKGFSVVHEYEFRIKIYKKEGLGWGNYKVPYYVGYEKLNNDVLKFSNGITYNLENGAVVKTKLNSEGSFKKNVNEYWNEGSIAMPNVKVGSVIEFRYELKSENILKFPVFNFQQDIPVNYAEYVTEVPEFLIYKPVTAGFFKVKSDAKIVNGYQNFLNEHNQNVNLSFQQINSIYIAENVPALRTEDYVDNLQNYRSSIKHELDRTRFPDAPIKDYSTTWEGVANLIFKEKDFGKQLKERAYLDQDLRMIIRNATTNTEKTDIIFKFIQHKMNWNGEYSYYCDKGVKKAYEDGTGNSAEINCILIGMLNYAGIKADAVLTSTVDHGIPVFPNRTVFNYVIAAAEVDGHRILMDATSRFTAPNILPFYVLNWTGRLIREDGTSEEVNLVPTLISKEIANIMVAIDASGKASGKCRLMKNDYEALHFREQFARANQENYLEKLEDKYGDLKISNYSVENKETDLSKPVVEIFNFASDEVTETIDGKIYIDPLLFFRQTKNPFVQEKRELPIYFGYPAEQKYNINFEIPEGYIVESLPKSITIATPENIGVFAYKVLASENKVQVSVTSDRNSAMLSADFYDTLKTYYKQIIDKQNEKIVLKKI